MFSWARSGKSGMGTCMKTRHQTGGRRVMTHRQTHVLLSLVPGQGMMQNIASRFRAGAIADLWAIGKRERLGCFFGKLGLAEPSHLSARAPVCRFSILAFLQKCDVVSGIAGLLVKPILCAWFTKGVAWDVPWAAAGEAGCTL
jgi:hypothetical protein